MLLETCVKCCMLIFGKLGVGQLMMKGTLWQDTLILQLNVHSSVLHRQTLSGIEHSTDLVSIIIIIFMPYGSKDDHKVRMFNIVKRRLAWTSIHLHSRAMRYPAGPGCSK